MKLSKKAERLLDFLADYETEHGSKLLTIGEICKGCKTTPKTLLTKTYPELEKYIKAVVSNENESCR